MGIDSKLLNTETKEYFDVRGFWRYKTQEIRDAIKGGKEALCTLLNDYTEDNKYKEWIADRILALAFDNSDNILLCSDDFQNDELACNYSWYDIYPDKGYKELPDIWDYFKKDKLK